jgi:hypothetical protein
MAWKANPRNTSLCGTLRSPRPRPRRNRVSEQKRMLQALLAGGIELTLPCEIREIPVCAD